MANNHILQWRLIVFFITTDNHPLSVIIILQQAWVCLPAYKQPFFKFSLIFVVYSSYRLNRFCELLKL